MESRDHDPSLIKIEDIRDWLAFCAELNEPSADASHPQDSPITKAQTDPAVISVGDYFRNTKADKKAASDKTARNVSRSIRNAISDAARKAIREAVETKSISDSSRSTIVNSLNQRVLRDELFFQQSDFPAVVLPAASMRFLQTHTRRWAAQHAHREMLKRLQAEQESLEVEFKNLEQQEVGKISEQALEVSLRALTAKLEGFRAKLPQRKLSDRQVTRLNRLVLQTVYPNLIVKSHQVKVLAHQISPTLPVEAQNWKTEFANSCTMIDLAKVKDFAQKLSAEDAAELAEFASLCRSSGWLDCFLLKRPYPAIVFAAAGDLEKLVKNEDDLHWLKLDAFMFFITDKQGAQIAKDHDLRHASWQSQNQQSVLDVFSLFDATDNIKGFSETTCDLREKIVAYASELYEGRAEDGTPYAIHPPLFILGDNRVGKELVASSLHRLSGLPETEYKAIPCGMLEPNMVRDKIFGHWKGAFTGADRDAPGALEIYSDGTVYLDDLDAATIDLQGMLLRFLSSRPPEVERLGIPPAKDRETIKVNTWLLCSTNRPPRELIDNKEMRSDFFYRFHHIIRVPPFHRRREDIPYVVQALLGQMSGRRPLSIAALKWLRGRKSKWKGNAGEMQMLLVCALDLFRKNPRLGWVEAFELILQRGEGPLDWYDLIDEIDETAGVSVKRTKTLPEPGAIPVEKSQLLNLLRDEVNSGSKSMVSLPTWTGLNENNRAQVEDVLNDFLNHNGRQLFEDFRSSLETTKGIKPEYYIKAILFLALRRRNEATFSDLNRIFTIGPTRVSEILVKVFGIGELRPRIKEAIQQQQLDKVRELGQKLVMAKQSESGKGKWNFSLDRGVLQSLDPISA